MSGKKTVCVAVGVQTSKHDFFVANIQEMCIIGLDLLTQWDTMVDIAARQLRASFGVVALCEPE